MSEVEKAESIIADLERRRVQLIAAGNVLTTERDDSRVNALAILLRLARACANHIGPISIPQRSNPRQIAARISASERK